MLFRIILAVMVCSLTACAAKTVYIKSSTDPSYSPIKTDPIYVIAKQDASIEDRQFVGFLRGEMQAAGFKVVDHAKDSRYILLCATNQNTSQINSTLFLPTTQTTSGYVGSTYYSGQTQGTTAVPYSYDYTVQGVALMLYATADVASEKYITAWEGKIGSEQAEYKKHSREIIRMLLDVFGTDYEGHTPIRPLPSN